MYQGVLFFIRCVRVLKGQKRFKRMLRDNESERREGEEEERKHEKGVREGREESRETGGGKR